MRFIDPDGMAAVGADGLTNEQWVAAGGNTERENEFKNGNREDEKDKKKKSVSTGYGGGDNNTAYSVPEHLQAASLQNASISQTEFNFSPEDEAAQLGVNIAGTIEGVYGIFSLLKNGLKTLLGVSDEYINLASVGRTKHIIGGDGTGGGHAWFGSLKSFTNGLRGEKSMFPSNWSNSKIMNAISDVAVNNEWVQQTGKAGSLFTKSGQPVRFVVEGNYQGTKIRVITNYNEIITAFPIK